MTQPRPDDALAREANLFARYLLHVDCPPELAERYAAALRHEPAVSRQPQAVSGKPQSAVAAFAVRHPWSLPYIAAAAPWFGAGAQLRWKLTVMSAVLETTPRFARDFLPRELPLPRLLVELAGAGIAAGVRAAVGVPLLLIARATR